MPNRSLKGQRSDLPFSRKSDRKKEICVVSLTHEQVTWRVNEKEGKLASNDKKGYLTRKDNSYLYS